MNYCGNDKWLAGVYAIDMQTDFILASDAHGRPPAFVLQEAGFEFEGDSSSSDLTSYVTPHKKAKDSKAELEKLMAEGNKNFAALVSVAKQRAEQQVSDFSELDAITKINDHKRKLQDDPDFSPNTKQKMQDALIKKKRSYARQMIERAGGADDE